MDKMGEHAASQNVSNTFSSSTLPISQGKTHLRRRWSSPIRSVRSHRSRKHNTPLNPQLNKLPRGRLRTRESPKYIQPINLLDLRAGEIQRRLMFRHARIGNHPVQRTLGLNDRIQGLLDRGFVRDVHVQVLEAIGVFLRQGGEVVVVGLREVERVDDGGWRR
jgi:hypothetical protein